MTLKALTAVDACDILDFWVSAPWPMQIEQTHQYASQLGWTVEEEDGEKFLVNESSVLTEGFVDANFTDSGDTAAITFYTTDVAKGDITDESTAFLNDQFTLLYREAISRWGAETKQTSSELDGRSIEWELPGDKGRIGISQLKRVVTADFSTPMYAKVLSELGE